MPPAPPTPPTLAVDYAPRKAPTRRWRPSRGDVAVSLVPAGVAITLITAGDRSPIWPVINRLTDLDRERTTGLTWMAAAACSVGCFVVLCRCQKRWDVWTALAIHGAFLAFTVFPGSLAIPFLMHWGHGPGW